jgi:hypothetical protein
MDDVQRVRVVGPLGPYAAGFGVELTPLGYTVFSARRPPPAVGTGRGRLPALAPVEPAHLGTLRAHRHPGRAGNLAGRSPWRTPVAALTSSATSITR